MARWSMDRRHELAAAKMRAAGIPLDPSVRPDTQWRRLSAAARAEATEALARRDPTYRGGGRAVPPTARQRAAQRRSAADRDRQQRAALRRGQATARRLGGRMLATEGGDYLRRALRGARGQRVAVYFRVQMPDGTIRQLIHDGRPIQGYAAGVGAEVLPGPWRVVIAPPGEPVGGRWDGILAGDLLDALSSYDAAPGDLGELLQATVDEAGQ